MYFKKLKDAAIIIGFGLLLIFTIEHNAVLRDSGINNIITATYPNFATVFFVGIAIALVDISQCQKKRYCIGYALGIIIYECCQLLIAERTFDINDLIVSAVTFCIVWLFLVLQTEYLHKAAKNMRQQKTSWN